jgi:hypothetical protein
MTALLDAIRRIVSDLDAQGSAWALVGGLAVSARTEPRTTRDVDVAVTVPDDAAAEAMIWSLTRAGYTVAGAVEQTDTQRLATVRLHPPSSHASGVIVDLLFASSGIEPELVGRATRLEIVAGLELPVASIGDLVALKVLSRDDDRRPRHMTPGFVSRGLLPRAGRGHGPRRGDASRAARDAARRGACTSQALGGAHRLGG